jgi:hypothetical protein
MNIILHVETIMSRDTEIITRAQIEEAQRHTRSNMAAARYLNVPYMRYKKYAELYGLFAGHLNQDGIGIDKGWSKKPTSIPLREILENKHPTYSHAKLKNRLIARKKLPNECSLCGFHEARITDGMVPLMMSFKDGNKQNMQLDNLELLCYNCMFLTTGAPSAVYRRGVQQTLKGRDDYIKQPDIVTADHYDPDDRLTHDSILSDEERQQLLNDIEDD